MSTATEQIMKRDDEARQQMIFEKMVEQFSRNFRPDDHYDGAEFDSMLHSIVRQIYRDAQQPLLDQIMKMAVAMPILPASHSR